MRAELADPCLPFCEVLEREYAELTGRPADPAPDWIFTPQQILEPLRLTGRLLDGHDRVSTELRMKEFKDVVEDLKGALEAGDRARLSQILSDRLNLIVRDPELFTEANQDRFHGVRFRSQTVDFIDNARALENNEPRPIVQRNRLILEDTFFELEKVYDIRLRNVYRRVREGKLAALCLSGGGIRSATFALGVVQGLARKGLLDQFAYLSTVSGGGYLGGWLSGWINHTSLPQVIRHLSAPSGRPLEPDPTPVWHLRTYSNYLTPKLGLLSADTWTLLATYLRNLFLNWLVVVPPLIGLTTALVLLAEIVRWYPQDRSVQNVLALLLAAGAFCCGVLTVRFVHLNRPRLPSEGNETELREEKRDQRDFLRWCLTPLVLSTIGAAIYWAWPSNFDRRLPVSIASPLSFGLVGACVHLMGWLLSARRGHKKAAPLRKQVVDFLFIIATGFLAGIALWYVAGFLPRPLDYPLAARVYVWLAVPLLLTVILVFTHLYIGYSSGRQTDAAREWSARYTAWILIVIGTWLGVVGLALLGPAAVAQAFGYLSRRGEAALAAGKAVVSAIGVVSGAVTLRLGQSSATSARAGGGKPTSLGLTLAAPAFVVSLVVLLGWLGTLLVDWAQGVVTGTGLFAGSATAAAMGVTLVVTVGLIGFGVGSARVVDVNKFSLHAMYRARLIRAYLGASRPAGERDPNRFTGFDEEDNLPIRDLWAAPTGTPAGTRQRPLHVVNAALNLVGGDNLAWQERKAESFIFSPLYCGAYNHGFRPTRLEEKKLPTGDEIPPRGSAGQPRGYGGDLGVSLGTAITISGAAASPNMGYHSSPLISLLLALFNLRLGWWLGNPGHAGKSVYTKSAPKSSLSLIKDEALGLTDSKNEYVYLSDGGHFENLGLYEMVLRRCETIVVSDAGCDPSGGFDDLGNAIRKIRVDFGIPIEFPDVPIYPRPTDGNVQDGKVQKGKYCAIGSIRYSCVDAGATDGTLIYIKPAFYGGEPRDVFNYAQTNFAFPHESTVDQSFSESQFESYRALGSYIIEQILPSDPPAPNPSKPPLTWLVEQTREYLRRS